MLEYNTVVRPQEELETMPFDPVDRALVVIKSGGVQSGHYYRLCKILEKHSGHRCSGDAELMLHLVYYRATIQEDIITWLKDGGY